MRLLKVASCNLKQWAMDFDNNMKNIKESISKAKEAGAVIRWECLKELLVGDWTDGILCSFGMPIMYGSERYNCQVLCMNRKIIMIRPKLSLANDGNYMEFRRFTSWKQMELIPNFQLPPLIADAISQNTVPFGYGYIRFADTSVAVEICEELYTPQPPHAELALAGVEVFMNASGSHHELGKNNHRMNAMISASRTCKGVYMYSNSQGCDGGRLGYDGSCCVVINGDVVAQGSQFSLKDVEVVVAQVDLEEVGNLRGSISSFQEQSSSQTKTGVPCYIDASGTLCRSFHFGAQISYPLKIRYHEPEEEIGLGPACWLWDYLRRSGASGFLLPLSGGADSSSVAAIVGFMCKLVVKEILDDNEQVKADAIRIGQYCDGQFPIDSKEFAKRIFYTVYMGTENSSNSTRSRAKVLADEVGAWHIDVCIDNIISTILTWFQALTGKRPRYKVDGGSNAENLGLQNIQARMRMVLSYMLASLMPWVNNKSGFCLVLASSNTEEGNRGYSTKYDCSSADINPIGGISKTNLRAFLRWAAVHLGYSSLAEVEAAPPTAELEPICSNYTQLDEVDMGMTYEELSTYGKLRKLSRCGPVSMFQKLCSGPFAKKFTPSEIGEKVKCFFKYYSINRHKMTVMTPSYHAEIERVVGKGVYRLIDQEGKAVPRSWNAAHRKLYHF